MKQALNITFFTMYLLISCVYQIFLNFMIAQGCQIWLLSARGRPKSSGQQITLSLHKRTRKILTQLNFFFILFIIEVYAS